LMRRYILFLVLGFCICPAIYADNDIVRKAYCYIKAYPDFFIGYTNGCLVTKDGHEIPFDDGIKSKDYDKMIIDKRIGDKAFDPEDALYWSYHAGSKIPTVDNPPIGDPGRIRPGEIFTYMYGSSKSERMKKIRSVQWVGSSGKNEKPIYMTTVNGVDKALEEVARELKNLPEERKKNLEGIIFNVGGYSGYYDRPVRDYPRRTSAHAYGIAVDVNRDYEYYIGQHRGEPYRYRNKMPQYLVDIFERHGFIWGGRWHDYDNMHFEYRPEVLLNDSDDSQPIE